MNNTEEKLDKLILDVKNVLKDLIELREDYLVTNSESRRRGIEYILNIWDEYLKCYRPIRNPFAKREN